jgi:hypothetical protein
MAEAAILREAGTVAGCLVSAVTETWRFTRL